MENKNITPDYRPPVDDVVQAPMSNAVFEPNQITDVGALSFQNPASAVQPSEAPIGKNQNLLIRLVKRADVILAVLLILTMVSVLIATSTKDKQAARTNGVGGQYETQQIPLDEFETNAEGVTFGSSSIVINGATQLNGGLVIAPSLQPSVPKAGQLYFDDGSDQLAYYDGTRFIPIGAQPAVVESIGGTTGQFSLGGGLGVVGNQLVNGGVLSVGGQTGAIAVGNGLTMVGGSIQNNGVVSLASASPALTVTNDGNGNLTLTGSGSGTVSSGGGTAGRIALFTGAQNIEDSIITQAGLTVTISGDLSVVTGGLSLSNALTVSNGGTGTNSLAANGLLLGNGTSAITTVTSGGPGLCLISNAGAPSFTACPSASGVTSLNGLNGGLSVANASGAGNVITVDNASALAKGIASFNATNFSVVSGAVNTIQNINTTATPTFSGVNTNNITPGAALTVGISAQTALLQGSTTTITSSGAGNDIILNSADTIELQDNTNVAGNVVASGDIAANGGDLTSSGSLNITPGGTLTAGVSAQTLTLQGNASTSLRATDSGNTTIVGFTSPTANTTLNFPALTAGTYTICTTSGNCTGTAATLQSAYDNSTNPEIVLDATRGAVTIRDNATPLGANLLEVQNNGGGTTYLAVTASGLTVTGTATISGSINTTSGGLQTNSTTRIDNSGNLTNIGTVTLSGAISGGTSFTGSGNINTTGGVIQTNSTTRIDNSGNLTNIGAVAASGSATFQGGSLTLGTNAQAGTVVFNDGSSNTGTLQVAALGQNTVYTLPDPGTGTVSICLTTGNCAGLGGGVTGTGTNNRITKFTSTGSTVGDSTITDNGTAVTTTADLVIQGGDATIGVASTQTGTLNFADSTSAFLGSIVQGGLGDNRTYTLPDANGTVCLSSGNCLGGGGGGANVSLSNLTSVAINTTLLPGIAGTVHLGSGTLPFGDAFLAGSSGTPGTNNFRITGTSTSGTRVITLPDASGTVCLQSSASCGFAPSTGSTSYIQNQIASPQTSADFSIDGDGRAATFNGVTGINTGAGAGTQRIDASGNLANIVSITLSGAISGATSFTGSGNINTTGGALQTNSISRIDVSGNVINIGNITGTGAVTIASTGASNDIIINGADTLDVQDVTTFASSVDVSGTTSLNGDVALNGTNIAIGNAASDLVTINGIIQGGSPLVFEGGVADANELTIAIASLGGDQTITFPDATGTVCLTTGNCAGSGGGVTTSGGSTGTLPVFTGPQTIGDSLVSQAGATVTVNGHLSIAAGNQYQINGTQIASGSLSNDADLAKLSTSQTFVGSSNAFQNGSNSVNAFNVQNATGGRILTVDTTNGELELGVGSALNGRLVFANVTNNNTVTIIAGTPSTPRTLTLPDADGIICTDAGNCAGVGATLQTGYNFSTGGTTPKIKLNNTLNGVDIQDADTTIGTSLFNIRASNGSGLGSAMLGVSNTGAITLQNSANSPTALRLLTQGGTTVLVGDTTNGQTILGQSSTLDGKLVFNNATNGNQITLTTAAAGGPQTITLPNSTGTVCLTSGNCVGVGGTGDILQGGNSFAADVTIGTNDGFDLVLERQNAAKLTVGANNVTLASDIDLVLQGASAYISNPQTQTNSEAFGQGATVNAANAVAIGYNATSGGTAIGASSTASAQAVAVGAGASAPAGGTALGASTSVAGTYGVAIGVGASAGFDYSIALGAGMVTTAVSQLVVGPTSVYIGGVAAPTPTNVSIQGATATANNGTGAAVTLKSGDATTGTCGTACNGGALTIQGGAASGPSGTRNGGAVYIDGGAGATSNGTINIGTVTNSDIVIGKTTGTNSLTLQAGSSVTLLSNNASGSITARSATNTATAFRVQDSASAPLFTVDTTARSGSGGNLIKIGDSTGTDGATTVLQLDATSADLTSNLSALNGGLFYNSNTNKISLIENGVVKIICNTTDLGCGTGTVTLQTAYANSSNPEISLGTAATAGITILDNATPIAGNLLEVQNNGGGTTYLGLTTAALTLGSNVDIIMQGATAYISNPQTQAGSEVFGLNAVSGSTGQTVIGNGANAGTSADNIAIGNSADVAGSGASIAIGTNADVRNNQSVGIGHGVQTSLGGRSTAIGYNSSANGTGATAFGYLANASNARSIALGYGATTTADNQFVIGSDQDGTQGNITHVVVGSGVTDDDPAGFTLQGTSGSGNNIAGASVILAGGQGTGTGSGGGINLQIADPGSSGASLNPLATVLGLSGTNGAATFQNTTDSANAFRVLNVGGEGIINVDTLNRIFSVNGAISQAITANDPPQLVATMASTNYRNAQGIDVQGNYAYIVSDNTTQRFTIVDITNPASPVEVSSTNSSTNLFYPKHIRVKGKYAYIVNDINTPSSSRPQFVIYDISNPNSPTLVGSINDDTNFDRLQSMEIVGSYAYVASRDGDSFSVIDITNPTAPSRIATTASDSTNFDGPKFMTIQGKYAYVSLFDGDDLAVMDISDPDAPVRISTVGSSALNGVNGSAIYGKYLYMAAENNHSFTVVNIEDPSAPVIGTALVDATVLNLIQDIDIFGRYAVVAASGNDRLAIIDLSSPASPTLLSNTQDATNLDGAQKAMMYGRYIYAVADGDDVSSTVGAFSIWEIGGFSATSADIGELRTNNLFADGDARVSGLLTVQTGLNVGGSATVQGTFSVNGGAGTPLLTANAANSRVTIGNPTADTTGALLVLDTKNDIGDPTGVDGAMYYNSAYSRFRCYQNNAWVDCIGGSGREYLRAEMIAVQDNTPATDVDSGSHLKYDSVQASAGGSVSLDTTSGYSEGGGASVGRFTLAAGKTYKLTANVPYATFSAVGHVEYAWYNVTAGAQVGNQAGLQSSTNTSHDELMDTAEGVITPAVTTIVEVRFGVASAVLAIGGSSRPHAFVEVLSDGGAGGASAAGYMRAEMVADQSTNVTTGDHLKFNSVHASSGSDITLDTATTYTNAGGASVGRFTLSAGKTYMLRSTVPRVLFGSADSSLQYQWYNVTAGAALGTSGGSLSATWSASTVSNDSFAETIIKPSATTLIELRMVAVNGTITSIGDGGSGRMPSAFIEVISDGTKIAQFTGATAGTAGQSGFVPGAAAGQQGAVLLGDGTWSAGVSFISGAATFQNVANSTTAFRVLSDTGSSSVPQFVVDTTNSRVYIGNPASDVAGALLVLDTKSGSGDPTGVAGGMYYNSSSGKMRCYENGFWRDCIHSARTALFISSDFMSNGADSDFTFGTNAGAGTTNSSSSVSSVAGHPGVIEHNTGTTTTGRASIMPVAEQGILLGNNDGYRFEAVVRIPTLSDVTNTYTYRTGFLDDNDGESVDGCFFRYTYDTLSGRWQGVCRSNNAESTCDTTITVGANTWFRLTVAVNAAGNSADFQTDGVSRCQVTSNIPTGAGRGTSYGSMLKKSAGTTNRTVDLDYMEIQGFLGTPR